MKNNRRISTLFLINIVLFLVAASPPLMAVYDCSDPAGFKGDADLDGVINGEEDLNANGDCDDDDSDDDNTANYLDPDDDNDGIPTIEEDANGNGDPTDDDHDYSIAGVLDPDGIPNYLDLDSDEDGYPDAIERNGSDDPTGRDPVTDYDMDGTPDYIDPDSDNDTVLDQNEIGANTDADDPDAVHPPGNTSSGDFENRRDLDDDGDCILTSQEYNETVIDPALAGTLRNADFDSLENYIDLDSDNDGYLDAVERGSGPCHNLAFDFDSDLANDYLDLDSDNDSVQDIDELDGNTDALCAGDCISDALNDRVDADDDGDTVPTVQEDVEILDGDPRNDDSDDDAVADYLDPDDDNDGVPTHNEDPNGNGNPTDDDSDGDSLPDYLDFDSPGPKIFDSGFEFEAELEVTKQCSAVASPGEVIAYVIGYRVATERDFHTVSIADELPPGFQLTDYDHEWNDSYVSNNPAGTPPDINFHSGQLLVEAGPLSDLEGGTLIVWGIVDAELVSGQVLTNEVIGVATWDGEHRRESTARCSTLIGNPDLYLKKSGNPVETGAVVFQFRLVLSNQGVHAAGNVALTDILPNTLTYINGSTQVLTPGWSISPDSEPHVDGSTLIWSRDFNSALTMTGKEPGEIPGQSGDIEITYLVEFNGTLPPGTILENCAEATSDAGEDDNFENMACAQVSAPD